MEKDILQFFAASEDHKRLLFVGVANYTAGYHQRFKGNEFWTMDFDPDKQKYGSDHHIVGWEHTQFVPNV